MSTRDLLVDVFLVLGVGCQAICCVGVLAARTVYDRLHFSGAATAVGPVCLGIAILVRESVSSAGIQTIVTVLLLFLLNPVVLVATARAARRIDGASPDEPPARTRRPR